MRRLLGVAVGLLAVSIGVAAAGRQAAVADAAMQRDAAAVRAIVRQGGDVNAAQGDGMTALHWAARHGDVALARMLLLAGANVKAATRLGAYTPLLLASQAGHAALIGVLLEAGADPNTPTANGATPLMLAAGAGKADAVRALLARGADVHAKETVRGETALMFAAAYNRIEAMRLLLAKGAAVADATTVVELGAQTNPDEEAFLRAQQGGGRQQGAPRGPRAQEPAVPPAATPPVEAPRQRGGRGAAQGGVAGLTRQFRFAELVAAQGGLTPLLFAARQGHADAASLLLGAGADVNQVSAGDGTSPLLMAVINGHFDLAATLLAKGARATLASENGVTPLYAVLNCVWAPKALYPQPRAHLQQRTAYLDLMKALLDAGADVNARLKKKVWYSGYNFDLSGVDEVGATPFWRAAYAGDLAAMRLLVSRGADPHIPTTKPAGRPRTGDGGRETVEDVSGLPAVPVGGPAVPPLHAASGVGYGEGFAANSHRHAPGGWMPAVRYLVEEMGADVNARDHEGNTALHHAAARGDNEMIRYLVARGADVRAVNRAGETTVDMANGPVQRVQPFPDTIALLEGLGAKNNHRCKSC
jgi:ankyrin repeat protein